MAIRAKKKDRSLQKYQAQEKFSFSQVVAATLLVVSVITTIVIVFPLGWKNVKKQEFKKDEKFLLAAIDNVILESKVAFDEIKGSIQTLRKFSSLSLLAEPKENVVHVNIPKNDTVTSTDAIDEQISNGYTYVNSDWQVRFDLPIDFKITSFQDKLTFFSSTKELSVLRKESLDLADGWKIASTTHKEVDNHPFMLYSQLRKNDGAQNMQAVIITKNYFYIFNYRTATEEDNYEYFTIIKTFKEL